MVTALKANALVTLADALDELGLTSDAGVVDRRVTRYINAASQAIESYCTRKFYREILTAERYPAAGGPRLVLNRTPVLTLTSITIDSTVFDATDYTLEDVNSGVVYMRSKLPWQGMRRWGI